MEKMEMEKNSKIVIANNIKSFNSDDYNYKFNMINGFTCRYGKNLQEDPEFSPFGPEIIDIELSTICNNGCPFCYKSNTSTGKNMSFETIKTILNKFPKIVGEKDNEWDSMTGKCEKLIYFCQQIAYGIGNLNAHKELFKILKYTREIGIIPNITINSNDELDSSTAKYLSMVLGACAISNSNKENCYNKIELLNKIGLQQVNIHQVFYLENLENCYKLIDDSLTDSRLEKLNAIVFLMLKKKGRGINYNNISQKEFNKLINYAFDKKIRFGMDSCTAPIFLESIKNNENKNLIETMVEPCESLLESFYINVDGFGFPCSFIEGTKGWEKGLDITNCDNFLKDIWNHPKSIEWRNNLLKVRGKSCPVYNI